MARHGALAIVLALAAPVVTGCAADRGGGPFVVGEHAPPLESLSLEGGRVSLRDFRGRVVLVDFWATWCGPCHLQAEVLKALHQEYGGRDVQFLALSLGESRDVVRQFVERRPFPYPVLIDPEDLLSARHEIFALPSLLLVGRDGRVLAYRPGLTDLPTLRQALDAALVVEKTA